MNYEDFLLFYLKILTNEHKLFINKLLCAFLPQTMSGLLHYNERHMFIFGQIFFGILPQSNREGPPPTSG
jgi:hypothetical protein